jgi:hypothetical protein
LCEGKNNNNGLLLRIFFEGSLLVFPPPSGLAIASSASATATSSFQRESAEGPQAKRAPADESEVALEELLTELLLFEG